MFIDTGPAKIDLIEPGIAVADLVLIPTRPSAFDIEQAAITVELCESHGKPHAFVLNHAPAGVQAPEVVDRVPAQNGEHRISTRHYRFGAYMAALTVGKSGPEVDKNGVARKEIDALWACGHANPRGKGGRMTRPRRRGHADPGAVRQA